MVEKVGTYFYIFPEYTQGRKILWDGIDKEGFKFLDHIPQEIRKRTSNQEMIIELVSGSIFQVVGADKGRIDTIVGTNPIGCVFSEYSLQDPRAWDYIRPILAENGGWCIFNFTPRGENHAYDLLSMAENNDAWFTQVLTVDDTQAIPKEVLKQEREEIIQKNGDDSLFLQEYYCSFTGSVQGAFYVKQLQDMEANGRMCKGLYEPTLPVDTWWDLGMDDSMSIVFTQIVGKELRIIDYLENSGEGLSFYAKQLQEKKYVYGEHNFPHDGDVREMGTGVSRKETAMSLGIKPLNIIKRPDRKEDGIEAVRSILPKCWIDTEKCARLIACLKNFTKEYDEINKVFKNRPVHNWATHGADSVQTFALGYKAKMPTVKLHFSTDKWGRTKIQKTPLQNKTFGA